MDDSTRHLLRAADRLADTADQMQTLLQDMHTRQSAQYSALKRLADLLKAQGNALPPRDRAVLAALTGKLAPNRRMLDQQATRVAAAQAEYRLASGALQQLALQYGDQLVTAGRDRHRQHRRDAALMRCLPVLFRDRLTAAPPPKENVGTTAAPPQPEINGFTLPDGSHSYIILDIARFLDGLIVLDEQLRLDPDFAATDGPYRPLRFLEIGSGPGRNMVIARDSGLLRLAAITGFDIDPRQIALGQRQFGLGDALFVQDALKMDYGGFDVVYFYRIFADPDLQQQLEARLADTMTPGAYLFAAHPFDLLLYPEMHRVGANTEVWKKRPATSPG